MPTIRTADGTRLNFLAEGARENPAVMLAHSIGCNLALWDRQAAALRDRFYVVRFDTRGHGRSDAPTGAYRIDHLGHDALAILDHLAIEATHFCGLSLGGTVGLWLAINAPARLKSLTLADTSARLGTIDGWQARMDAALTSGTASIADFSMTRFFSEAFREREPAVVEAFRHDLIATADHGFAGCCAVLRDSDFRGALDRVSTPTLIVCGALDVATPPSDSEDLAQGIARSRMTLLNGGHLSAVEDADGFTAALRTHIGAC